MIKSPAIAILCALLAFVFWLGATVYSENIQLDISARTQQEIDKHRADIPDISRSVDGRDVTVHGSTTVPVARAAAAKSTLDVWGVRTLDNDITVSPKVEAAIPIPFHLNGKHAFPNLWVSGQVDEPAYELISNMHRALPPESVVDYSELKDIGSELSRSSRIVESGIAAVTQMNPGALTITDRQFILNGTVFSEDRKKTIEQLIEVRRPEIEPLEIIVNIVVASPGISQACRAEMEQVLANNVLNYEVDHFKILDKHLAVLVPMANTILGVCEEQISRVLVEGHADYTGGFGYNQGLSERRSGTVRDYLIRRGIDPKLISAFGYGEFRPIANNETAEGRAMNRRTEIYLLTEDQSTGSSIPESASSMNSTER